VSASGKSVLVAGVRSFLSSPPRSVDSKT
jgi:hypothetical protein